MDPSQGGPTTSWQDLLISKLQRRSNDVGLRPFGASLSEPPTPSDLSWSNTTGGSCDFRFTSKVVADGVSSDGPDDSAFEEEPSSSKRAEQSVPNYVRYLTRSL